MPISSGFAHIVGIVLACGGVGCSAQHPSSGMPLPTSEPVPAEFQRAVAEYVVLHERVAATVPPVTDTNEPAKLRARQQQLAAGIRQARPNARPGAIFSPEVVPYFRRIVKADFKARTDGEKEAALEEVPQVPFKIGDQYPENAPLATVPALLLARMPRLPKRLEYRFFGRHLILLDVDANLIVDYIPGLLSQPNG